MATTQGLKAKQHPEGSDLEPLSQGGPKPAGWSWNDELEEELARGERLPAGERVRVPEAPPETLEAKDALIEHGESLGARGRGRAPLDSLEEKARTTERAGRCPASRACTDEQRGLDRPKVDSSALRGSNLPPASELLIVERSSFASVLGYGG